MYTTTARAMPALEAVLARITPPTRTGTTEVERKHVDFLMRGVEMDFLRPLVSHHFDLFGPLQPTHWNRIEQIHADWVLGDPGHASVRVEWFRALTELGGGTPPRHCDGSDINGRQGLFVAGLVAAVECRALRGGRPYEPRLAQLLVGGMSLELGDLPIGWALHLSVWGHHQAVLAAQQIAGPQESVLDPLRFAGRCLVEVLRCGGEVDDLATTFILEKVTDHRLDLLRTSTSDIVNGATDLAAAINVAPGV